MMINHMGVWRRIHVRRHVMRRNTHRMRMWRPRMVRMMMMRSTRRWRTVAIGMIIHGRTSSPVVWRHRPIVRVAGWWTSSIVRRHFVMSIMRRRWRRTVSIHVWRRRAIAIHGMRRWPSWWWRSTGTRHTVRARRTGRRRMGSSRRGDSARHAIIHSTSYPVGPTRKWRATRRKRKATGKRSRRRPRKRMRSNAHCHAVRRQLARAHFVCNWKRNLRATSSRCTRRWQRSIRRGGVMRWRT
mmetsp:Transcript_36416/g.78624  ORF Transcript_36416/g.78624 Transcript_36416/m.78624 type:complete len:241 (+) Transcript_36416:641-1363(+)